MAVATGLAIAGMAMSAFGGVSKAISGGKQKRAARKAAKNFKRQELKNIHEGRSVITRGSKMALEENARLAATSMKALEAGGIRGVVGGSQGVQEGTNKLNQNIANNLDKQQFGIDRDKSRDELRIQYAQEARDTQELNNIQAQMNAGAQTQASGYGDLAQGAFSGATGATGGAFGGADGAVNKGQGFDYTPDENIGAWSMQPINPVFTTGN